MKPEPDQFQDLRRLLALKRYEQPPPGFHDRFARQVMARIRAGEESSVDQASWLQRFWTALETKPVFAGAFGATVCLALAGGIFYTSQVEDNFSTGSVTAIVPTATSPVESPAMQVADMPDGRPLFLRAIGEGGDHASKSLVPAQERSSLFEQFRLDNPPTYQPVTTLDRSIPELR